MRVIICGSRGLTGIAHMTHLENAIRMARFEVTHVIHGANYDSVDALAEKWAKRHKVPFTTFPMESREELESRGIPAVAAGPRRNKRMIVEGHASGCIALWDGQSPGTADMVKQAKRAALVGLLYRLNAGAHEHWPDQLSLF